jgi:hypothetical protein
MAEPLAIQVLRSLIATISNFGHDAAELNVCIDALGDVAGSTIAQKIRWIKAYRKKGNPSIKASEQLRSLVESTCTLYLLTGPKSVAKDLQLALEVLCEGQHGSVSEFANQFSSPAPKASEKSKPRNSAPFDYRKFSDNLVRAIEDREEFERIVALLTAPKAHSMERINEVAGFFLGYTTSFKTKKQAGEALMQRQADTIIGGGQTKHIQSLPI